VTVIDYQSAGSSVASLVGTDCQDLGVLDDIAELDYPSHEVEGGDQWNGIAMRVSQRQTSTSQ
jgi:hypothetical protein